MSKPAKGNVSKAIFILALCCVVMIPFASFAGDKIHALSENMPFSVLGWWHESGPYTLASGVIDAVVSSLVAWRMQKLGM